MMLRSLDTLHRVNDLGAGVAAGALLAGRGLAGFLTAKPARLALQPADGSKGAVRDLAIDAAQDLALLSKDTAVVLGGGGALWAITDLQGEAKVKQIGRDIRALGGRAAGDSAIAIGEGGDALSLTASGRDVGVRAFTPRVALRACDLDEHAVHALVDADGGRQLRIHPGSTPEGGITARVALPDAAAGLDRVRGAGPLSAVYKRGEDRVCLVHGTGKLDARLVQLDGKVADIAWLDGALLVAFLDGRLSAFDQDAWTGAPEGPLAATATVPVGGQGRPRVLVAGTVKGAHTLWIGTTTGELFSSSRPADARPAVRPSEPRPDLAAQLGARDREILELRAELGRLAASHAAAQELRAAEHAKLLEEKDSSYSREIANREASYTGLLEERESAHARALEERDAAHAKALEERESAHAKALEERDAAHAKALEEKESAHAKVLEERDAAHAKALEERESAHRLALEEALASVASAERQVQERTAEMEERLRERDAQHQAALDAVRSKLAAVEQQLAASAAELEAHRKATLSLREEVSNLLEDLSRERERVEKTIPFGHDGLRSMERARETLGGVVHQIQGLLFRRRD